MGQTSPDEIPYPNLDDPPHGPNQMGALAERIQEMFDELVSEAWLWSDAENDYVRVSGLRIFIGPVDPADLGDVPDGSLWLNVDTSPGESP